MVSATANIGGSALKWEYTAAGGLNGSKGLTVEFNGTSRPFYAIGFGAPQPTASDGNPLGAGSVSSSSQIRFSLDLKPIGNLNVTPVRLRIFQQDPTYEADRQVDANMDGDMTDGAVVFQSDYFPTLASGIYSHVGFTLNDGQISASIIGFPTASITPEFDPTITLQQSIFVDQTGFGSDAGNSLSVDNIQIEVVPEPSALLLSIGTVCGLQLQRRRRFLRNHVLSY